MTWQERAACSAPEVDPEWFFPVNPGNAGNRAKAICNNCEVKQQCLTVALREPVRGIWGGTSEHQREKLRSEMGKPLPSGWAARNHRSRWEDRYHELRDLGYSDFDILRKLRIKPQSLLRQLNRYGIKPTPSLIELASEAKRTVS